MKYIVPFIAFSLVYSFSYSQAQDAEAQCARAVLGFLKSRKIIGGGDKGLCLSGLDSLPQINIGLGSETFPLGNATQGIDSDSDIKQKLSHLMKIFSTQSKSSISYVGYADGVNYNGDYYDKEFLAGKTTFTKEDVKHKLNSDVATMNAVLKELSKYKDSEEISFADAPKNASNLIKNFYLAKDRARSVCKASGQDCNDRSLNGFASPKLSALSGDKKECGARRRAVIQINGTTFGGSVESKDGVFKPNFSVPDTASDKVDLQLAAGLDLFKKLNSYANGDKNKYADFIETFVANQCSGDESSKQNHMDNFRKLLDHVNLSANSVKDKNFTNDILSGNYTAVKKRLAQINEKKNKTEDDKAELQLIDTVMNGYTETPVLDAEVYEKKIFVEGKVVTVVSYGPDNRYGDKDSTGRRLWRFKTKSGAIWKIKDLDLDKLHKEEDVVSLGKKVSPLDRDYSPKTIMKEAKTSSQYKNASESSPSTDRFNCLSASAAIEDKMVNSKGGRQMFYEASAFTKKSAMGADSISIELPVSSIPSQGKLPGWVCSYCSSGLQYDPNTKSFPYKPRDYGKTKDALASVTSQKSNKSLTFGSMKALSVYNIDRNALGTNCSSDKSVCECLKNIEPGQGNLDKILQASSKISLNEKKIENGAFKAEVSMVNGNDHCLFVPPVAHTCKVDPQGRSKDNSEQSNNEALSCQIFAKMKEQFPDFDASQATTYANIPLGEGAICKDELPTSDEEQDCGISTGTKAKSSSATQY